MFGSKKQYSKHINKKAHSQFGHKKSKSWVMAKKDRARK